MSMFLLKKSMNFLEMDKSKNLNSVEENNYEKIKRYKTKS